MFVSIPQRSVFYAVQLCSEPLQSRADANTRTSQRESGESEGKYWP